MTILLDEKQAAARLAVSVRTLQTWRVRGTGPAFVKMGAAVRYAENDLIAYIDQQRRQSTSMAQGGVA